MIKYKVKDFKMLVSIEQEYPYNAKEFIKMVNDHIEKGYYLFGFPDLKVNDGTLIYSQAVVLYESGSKMEKPKLKDRIEKGNPDMQTLSMIDEKGKVDNG